MELDVLEVSMWMRRTVMTAVAVVGRTRIFVVLAVVNSA
jgi:hypothetical protein